MWLMRHRLGVALVGALLAFGCATQPPLPTATQVDQAQATANEAQDARELKQFDVAASRTADGSRAYEYIWDSGWGPELVGHKIILLVRPDGGAVLLGAVNSPVTLTASAIRPFEDAVAGAGFPNLPSAGRNFLWTDGSPFLETFTASIGGRTVTSFGDGCGGVAIPVDKAVSALRALVDANGGPERRWRAIRQVPVAVRAFKGTRSGDDK